VRPESVAAAALAVIGVAAGVLAVERQARRAEYRFRQVRKLANTVLFDLNREIESLAGSTRAQELLVKTSLEYLDSLAAEVDEDPTLQLEVAAAYEKVGDVGNPRFANLGRPRDSLASYGKALAIARRLGSSRPALELLVRSYCRIGSIYERALGVQAEARENFRLGTRIADSITEKTGQPAYRLRAEAYGFLGDMDTFRDPATAAGPFRRSLEIALEWAGAEPSTESKYFLSLAMARMGTVFWQSGDLSQALEQFLGALRIAEELLKEQPENAVWRREVTVHWERVGGVSGHPQHPNLGDRKSAAGWFEKMAADMEQMLAADPSNLRARFDLSEATAELAAALRESDPARAERFYVRSLALSGSFFNSNPRDREVGYWQAFNRVGFAWVLRRLGKRSQALAELHKAEERLEELANGDPADTRFREYLGVALHTRAAHWLEIGSAAEAERDLQRSLGLLEPLHQANSRKLTLLRDVADCYQGFGDLSASRSNWKQAQVWYQKSLELWERWKQVGASSVYDRQRRDLAARLAAHAARNSSRNPSSR